MRYLSSFRWVVFVSNIDDGKRVSNLLGVEFYHAASEENPVTREERQAIYNRFLVGTFKGLVASTALGAGTDYPHIRLTCHLGVMYGMVNFVQQSSRAGRDGQTAHCIVIPNSAPPTVPDGPLSTMTGVREMHELVYVQTHSNPQKICIRRQIGKTMDGVGFTCFDFDITWELCGICQQGSYYMTSELLLYTNSE